MGAHCSAIARGGDSNAPSTCSNADYYYYYCNNSSNGDTWNECRAKISYTHIILPVFLSILAVLLIIIIWKIKWLLQVWRTTQSKCLFITGIIIFWCCYIIMFIAGMKMTDDCTPGAIIRCDKGYGVFIVTPFIIIAMCALCCVRGSAAALRQQQQQSMIQSNTNRLSITSAPAPFYIPPMYEQQQQSIPVAVAIPMPMSMAMQRSIPEDEILIAATTDGAPQVSSSSINYNHSIDVQGDGMQGIPYRQVE